MKALAEQTAKATDEIGQQISGIQAATQESVTAIQEISSTIEKLSEISATIAAAVEEQGAATQEIARNVQQAAQGTMEVSSNISDVQRGAGETGSASSQVLSRHNRSRRKAPASKPKSIGSWIRCGSLNGQLRCESASKSLKLAEQKCSAAAANRLLEIDRACAGAFSGQALPFSRRDCPAPVSPMPKHAGA